MLGVGMEGSSRWGLLCDWAMRIFLHRGLIGLIRGDVILVSCNIPRFILGYGGLK